MEAQFPALPELQYIVLKAGLLIHDEEIRFLSDRWVNIKEQLIVDERLNGIIEVISGEVGVNEGKVEDLIPEIVIYLLLTLAGDTRSDTDRFGVRGRSILTLPKFDLQVIHFVLIKVAENLVVIVIHAGVVVDSIAYDLGLVNIVETFSAAL